MMNTNFIGGNKNEGEQTSPVSEIVYSRIQEKKEKLLINVDTVYSPQALNMWPQMLTMHALLQKQLSEVALSKLEGLIALYLALSEVATSKGFLAVLTLYAKTHSQTSLVSQLSDITHSLFDTMSPQDSSGRPKWLEEMVSGLHDWKLLVNSPSFSKISRVLTLMVTMGIIDTQRFTLGNFEVFAIKAQEKQVNALDLLDALVETTVYFAEGAYQCFLQGSMRPILFSSSEVVEIEEAYIQKNTEFEYVRNGNLEKFLGKSEAQFDHELTELIEKLAQLYKTMPSGTEKKIVQTKWESLSKMNAEFTALRVRGGLRQAPYCVKIYGHSGVGKSTFADLTMSTVLKANGKPASSDYIVTLNEKEKYMSTYRSYVTGIKIDDYGNTKADYWETAPSDWIIKICNNIREAAIMADVANKGKISIEPACLTITTNVEGLHAGITSNCPMSILRRAHVHVELKVRPEFKTDNMLDSQKVIDKFGSLDKVNDIWLITLKAPVAAENKDHFNCWETIKSDIGIQEYLDYLVDKSRSHFRAQSIIVDSFKEPSNIIAFCAGCDKLEGSCECDVEPQFGERIASVVANRATSLKVRSHFYGNLYSTRLEDIAVEKLVKMLDKLEVSPYAQWTNWIPTQYLDNEYVKQGILYFGEDVIEQSVKSYVWKYWLFTVCVAWLLMMVSPFVAVVYSVYRFGYFALFFACIVETKKTAYLDAIAKKNGSLHAAFKSARDKHVQYACGLIASVGILYGIAQVVKALRKAIGVQGSLRPRTVEDIQKRDAEANPWAVSEPPVVVTSAKSYTDQDETSRAVDKVMAQIVVNGKFSGCFMLKTNVVLMPHHFLPKETSHAEITYTTRKIRFILNPKYASQVGIGDLVAVYVPNTGPLRDSTDFFADNYATHPLVCAMYGLDKSGEKFSDFVTWNQVTELNNGHMSFPGSHYRLGKGKTFPGMCMSLILRNGKRSHIVGFHIGGVAGTDRGCGITVLSGELNRAVEALYKMNDSFVCGPQAQEIGDDCMGKKIVTSTEVHRKCPTNFIDAENAAVEVYGSVIGRSSYSSAVIETPISQAVEEVTGVKNIWGPPRFDNPVVRKDGTIDHQRWKPWYASLDVCSKPSIGFDPADVERAMKDYTSELFETFDMMKECWSKEIRPLTDIEVVSGIDGKRFIDSMNMSTSMGYPLMAKKKPFIIELETTEEHNCPRTFVPEIWSEVEEVLKLADEGKALNQIFNASLKDEPTKVTKEKVRVFQAAPIVLQILIRKYFLPVARFLSANPLLAECGVGINSHGPEWHELSEFMASFGDDRIIAGDYSKYDLRMPEQLTLAAFSIMMQIAARSGNYSRKELKRMEVIAFEVCTPLVAYNGTLIRFLGTNPSGQNMTVYLNSIVNSLLHRLAFNDVYKEDDLVHIGDELGLQRPARFRDLVALMTYGDDAKGSVRVGYDKFNHISMANFLERNDMKFTMPDKESEPVAFMNRYDADFLKRKDCFNPDLGVYIGQLDEMSIFKSLHSILESKAISPIDVSRCNLEGALREWFFYGKKHFEMRQKEVIKIALKSGIESAELSRSYEERVEAWKLKYEPQSGSVCDSLDYTIDDVHHPIYGGVKYTREVRSAVQNYCSMPYSRLVEIYNEKALVPTKSSRNCRKAIHLVIKYRQEVPIDIWEASVCSMSTVSTPEAVRTEDELVQDVKDVLGEPTAEEYIVISTNFGKGDLLYVEDDVALVIECKRVVGRLPVFAEKVVKQALRYGNVMKALRPELTVYSMTFTEHGFVVVDVQGEPKFPARFADVLDIAEIHFA